MEREFWSLAERSGFWRIEVVEGYLVAVCGVLEWYVQGSGVGCCVVCAGR